MVISPRTRTWSRDRALSAAAKTAAVGSYILSIGSADEETKAFIKSLEDSKTAYEDLFAAMEEQTSNVASLETLENLLDLAHSFLL